MSDIYFITAVVTLILAYAAEHPAHRMFQRVVVTDGKTRYRPKKPTVVILAFFLIFVAGFRYKVGTDYGGYYRSYRGGFKEVWEKLITYDEPGMTLISTISRAFYDNGISPIFCAALITISLYISTIYKYSPLFTISMMLYIIMGEWHGSFNGVRQYLAAAVLFAGHRYILERKFLKYALVVLLASLFHKTALVMLIPYFLLTRVPDKRQILLLALGAIAIRLSYGIIFNLAGLSLDPDNEGTEYIVTSVNTLRILVQLVPIVVYLLFCKKGNFGKEETIYLNAMLFNSFTWVAAAGSAYLARVGIYTNALTLIGYPFLLNRIAVARTRRWTLAVLLILYFAFWCYQISISDDLVFHWWFTYIRANR